jgi:hypothetical protein
MTQVFISRPDANFSVRQHSMRTVNRQLNDIEISRLSESIARLEKTVNQKLNWTAIFILLLLTALFSIHIYYFDKSNWSLISKFLVCVCPIIIWVIIENRYKGRKKRTKDLDELKDIERRKTIKVIEINAGRIIEFSEKDDEGTLYLIERTDGQRIYLWDEQYLISEDQPFPCERFDIYADNNFKYAIEEKVNCIGGSVETIKVSGKDKWTYFKQRGFPDDLEIEKKTLDEVISEIKTIA